MNRRDISFVVSLTITLTVFFAIYAYGIRRLRHDLGMGLPLPGDESAPKLVQPEKLTASLLPMLELGEAMSTGHGINRSPGDEPMQSTLSDPYQEQALMTRDAFGNRGKNGSLASALTAEGDNGDNAPKGAQQQSANGSSGPHGQKSDVDPFAHQIDPAENFSPHSKTPVPPQLAKLVDPANKSPKTPTTPAATALPPDMIALADDSHPQLPTTDQKPAPAPPPPKPGAADGGADAANNSAENQGGIGGAPGASAAPGSPGPKSDFESIPVTNMQATQFRSGKLVPRAGRKILTRTLPDISITGWDDLRFVADTYVTLRLKIDDTGNVVDARILHGTGSDNIDLPCQRAAATWWFEPQKNPKTGQPLASDTIIFTIAFR